MPERRVDPDFKIPVEFNLDNFSDESLANMARSNLWQIIDNLPKKDERQPGDVISAALTKLRFLRSVIRSNNSLQVLLRRRRDIVLDVCQVETTRFSLHSLPPFKSGMAFIAIEGSVIQAFSSGWDASRGSIRLTDRVLISLWQSDTKLVKKFASMEKADILRTMVKQIPDFAG